VKTRNLCRLPAGAAYGREFTFMLRTWRLIAEALIVSLSRMPFSNPLSTSLLPSIPVSFLVHLLCTVSSSLFSLSSTVSRDFCFFTISSPQFTFTGCSDFFSQFPSYQERYQ
jgi:hypothetical protein